MATLLEQAEVGPEPTSADLGRNPWALAGRRLRRNRIALAAGGLFLLIVLLCLLAPLYAHDVAHVNPFPPNLNGHTVVNGKVVAVMQQGGGPLHISATSLWTPTVIIAFIFVPYVYRPVRGQVLSVVNKEFVEASIAQGASNLRLIFSEILPNVVSTVIVLLPLIVATTILTESALSFLSVGVQPPNVSWGTIIQDGTSLLYTRPWVSLAPGIMILLTVLSLNVLGDGVRDALDPRAKLRVEG